MLLIGIVTFNLVTAKTNNLLLLGKVIYIDLGMADSLNPHNS